MPTLVYQCPAGLSGDMNLGAMVGLGVDPKALEAELRKLPYSDWSLHFEKDSRQGISGLRCDVKLGSTDGHSHDHSHTHHHHHHHRTFKEIREAIESSTLSNSVKIDAINCFRVLAQAEAEVHGIDVDAVHFHEVGAIDSIIDMVGAAICWDLLGVDRVICTTLEVGGGTVQCAHGRMPVPAPATSKLLQNCSYTAGATNKECTTPTAAALLVGKSTEFAASYAGKTLKTAIAIGQRDDPNLANAAYVSLIEEQSNPNAYAQDTVYELAANLDDMTAEAIAFLSEQILKTGALDVWQTAATFKKGRLGVVMHALTTEADLAEIETTFFKYSRTLGVRRQKWQRSILKRSVQELKTPWGIVHVKIAQFPDGLERHKFEHEDCARIANEQAKSLDQVHADLENLYQA